MNQKVFVKFMAAAMNQFNRTVAGEIDNCCRIQINADVLDRRSLVLEDVATAQVRIDIHIVRGMIPINGRHRPAVALDPS